MLQVYEADSTYLVLPCKYPASAGNLASSATKFAPFIQEVAATLSVLPIQWRSEVGAVSSGIVGRTKKTPLWRVRQLRGPTECPRQQR